MLPKTSALTAKFRRAKGGVKAHVLLDHDDYLPRYVLITEGRRSDVKDGRTLFR